MLFIEETRFYDNYTINKTKVASWKRHKSLKEYPRSNFNPNNSIHRTALHNFSSLSSYSAKKTCANLNLV